MGVQVSYGELVGGRFFNVKLAEWNGQYGNPLQAHGKAKPKTPDQYRVVGQPVARNDVAPIVLGHADYVTDLRIPGMVHAAADPAARGRGRAGEGRRGSPLAGIAGGKVVWRKDFPGGGGRPRVGRHQGLRGR